MTKIRKNKILTHKKEPRDIESCQDDSFYASNSDKAVTSMICFSLYEEYLCGD